MPRAKQGGARNGTPGKGYSNRTDLMTSYDPTKNTAASGGMVAPDASPSHGETMQGPPMKSPDDSPMLTDPTARPGEPVTTGLASGPGAGPEALAGYDPRAAETQNMKAKWMPYLRHTVNDPETPESVKVLYRYMMGA